MNEGISREEWVKAAEAICEMDVETREMFNAMMECQVHIKNGLADYVETIKYLARQKRRKNKNEVYTATLDNSNSIGINISIYNLD